jgi:hypothetical protein
MTIIDIFDPAMCCSTGVCGPSIDPDLMRVATLVHAYTKKGLAIHRHNLSSEPQDFLSTPVVNELLTKEGADVLPIILVDGIVTKTKAYPTNEELAQWTGITVSAEPSPVRKTLPVTQSSGGCCGVPSEE